MRRLIAAAFFLVAGPSIAVADENDDAAKKLNGTFTVLEYLQGGKPSPKKEENTSFEFKDGVITITVGGKKEDTARFTLDPSKKPTEIDIMPGVPGNDQKVLGIYQLMETDKGTELTIAFSKGKGEERPKDFKGDGPRAIVIKMFRKK